MSALTPSIIPRDDDQTVYLVIDDLGRHGLVWREVDAETTDLETIVTDMLDCQYSNPVRVVAFNTAERWSRDVSENVAHEVRRRSDRQLMDLPPCLEKFVRKHEYADRKQLALRLV